MSPRPARASTCSLYAAGGGHHNWSFAGADRSASADWSRRGRDRRSHFAIGERRSAPSTSTPVPSYPRTEIATRGRSRASSHRPECSRLASSTSSTTTRPKRCSRRSFASTVPLARRTRAQRGPRPPAAEPAERPNPSRSGPAGDRIDAPLSRGAGRAQQAHSSDIRLSPRRRAGVQRPSSDRRRHPERSCPRLQAPPPAAVGPLRLTRTSSTR